jgi:hypothetical protein
LRRGQRFGRLRVVGRTNELDKEGRTHLWLLVCLCGGFKKTTAGLLRRGDVKSCGCWKRECERSNGERLRDAPKYVKHGKTGTAEYGIWVEMRRRCREEDAYAGRGITVCSRWQGVDGFANFLVDMGPRPGRGYTIERKNNDGPYAPENCVWLVAALQARNRRNTIRLTHNGETKTLFEWAALLGVPQPRLYRRYYYGWPIERILTP